MNVEEALIEVADRPLRCSPYSGVLIVVLRALLPAGESITGEITGQQVLTDIYNLSDADLQERILSRELGTVRNRDAYRTTLLSVSGIIGLVAVVITGMEIFRLDRDRTAMDVLGSLVQGGISVVKFVIGV